MKIEMANPTGRLSVIRPVKVPRTVESGAERASRGGPRRDVLLKGVRLASGRRSRDARRGRPHKASLRADRPRASSVCRSRAGW